MGYLFRVRMASFFAGAATTSLAGFCLLYKDYMLAHGAISQQVKNAYDNFDDYYEALNKRITALENAKVQPANPSEAFE